MAFEASCDLLSCNASTPVAAMAQALPTPALIKSLLDRAIDFPPEFAQAG
jgi:hypothetical protein